MKRSSREKKEKKSEPVFHCPTCGGTGADGMDYGNRWRCDRCHTWYVKE